MNGVLRIFRKDVRRFWPLAAALALLNGFALNFPELGLSAQDSVVVSAADDLRLLVLGLLAVLVIQDDLILSDRSDWLTRPISTITILAAKGLFLAGFILLPFGLIVAVACRMYQLALPGAEAVILHLVANLAVTVCFAAFIAAVTRSLLGVTLLLAGLWVALRVLHPFFALVPGGGLRNVEDLSPEMATIVGGILLGLLALHYARRQTQLTTVASLFAVAGLTACNIATHAVAHAAAVTEVHAQLTDKRGFVCTGMSRPFPLADEAVLGVALRYSSSTANSCYLRSSSARFIASDGHALEGTARGVNYFPGAYDDQEGFMTPWSDDWKIAKAVVGVAPAPQKPQSFFPILAMSTRRWDAFRGQHGRMQMEFVVDEAAPLDRGMLKIHPGAVAVFPGERLTVEAVRPGSSQMTVEIETRTLLPAIRSSYNVYFALRNWRTGEVSFEEYGNQASYYAQNALLSEGTRSHLFVHRWAEGIAEPRKGVSPDWVNDADLVFVLVGTQRLGSVTVEEPNFVMPSVGGTL